jgi:hypothetical protein
MTEAPAEGFYRACVKVYASESKVEDDAALFVPIFHEWIRDGALDMVMLDVADYAHAPDSPGIVLVCHEVSFSMDRSDGRFGILAQRRTPVDGTPEDAVARTLGHTLEVAKKLQADPRVSKVLKLDVSNVRVESNDRLRLPNSDAGYAVFAPMVTEAVHRVTGSWPAVSRVANDPRDRLAVEAWLS